MPNRNSIAISLTFGIVLSIVGACATSTGEQATVSSGSSSTESSANGAGAAAVESVSDSARASETLERLRDLHQLAMPAPARMDDFDVKQSRMPTTAPVMIPRPVLGSHARRLQRSGEWLRARDAEQHADELAVQLPVRASTGFRVREPVSGIAVETRLRGSSDDQEGEVADGFVVYRGAGPEGSTLLQNIVADGTEDFVSFERAPQHAEVSYQVALSPEVAGLRLVGNQLELLDETGDPRLRVAPPFIAGSNGERADAALSVHGCAFDASPVAPWGRAVVAPGATQCELRVAWEREAVSYPALLDPSWSSTNNMATARAFMASTILPNGRVLVIGGFNGGASLRTAEIYNPTTRTWAATGQMATARSYHTATSLLITGAVFVSGGLTTLSADTQTAELYNPANGAWTAAGSMIGSRFQHTATLMTNGSVLITGGAHFTGGGAPPLNTAEIFNPLLNLCVSVPNMPSTQSSHMAVSLASGNVLVVGGGSPNSMLFNPSSNAWSSTTGQMAESHTAGVLATIAGSSPVQILAAGGTAGTAEIFNTSTLRWSRTGSMSFPRNGATAKALANGTVVVMGGSPYTQSVEVFQPTWGTWAPLPPMATARYGAISELMSNGKVLIAGGSPAPFAATNTAEELTTTTAATTSAEYRLTPAVDADVLAGTMIEIWARLYRPATLPAGTRFPLIVMLHGNHGTCGTGVNPRTDDDCSYSTSGTCPANYSVVPSHNGYAYIADELASRGYMVLSINANRGITCAGGPASDTRLIFARGKLVLKHLQKMSMWDRGAEATPGSLGVNLLNRINFGQVGLMGHSRGGEGVRSAIEAYRVAGSPWPARIVTPVTFRALFEIGPTDFQRENALSVPRVALLPMCDGDVSNLSGLFAHDRMMATTNEATPSFKSTYTVWGANHNYYNTQWQRSEWSLNPPFNPPVPAAVACTSHRALFGDSSVNSGITGSAEQRQTGLHSMLAFFLGNVGTPQAGFNDWFDPRFNAISYPRVDRGYTPSVNTTQTRKLEEFDRATGMNTHNIANQASNVTVSHTTSFQHDSTLRVGAVSWASAGSNRFFQTNFAASGSGFNLTSYQYLDVRVTRQSSGNPGGTTNFAVQLVNANNTLSGSAQIGSYVRLDGPVGANGSLHPVLQTARIPLAVFSSATLSSIRGVRFVFNQTTTGAIHLANVRATRGSTTSTVAVQTPGGPPVATGPSSLGPTALLLAAQRSTAIQTASAVGLSLTAIRHGSEPGTVEIELSSTQPLPVLDSALELQLGSTVTDRSQHPGGNLRRVVFILPRTQWDTTANGAPLRMRIGSISNVDLGALDKALLR
jgi:hypothetical protein